MESDVETGQVLEYLALARDLVYASTDARFCQVSLRRGVVPDVGGAYLLPRLVGLQRAKQLMNTSTDGTLKAALEREALTQAMVLRSSSATAGFSSFLAKRA